MFLLLLILIYDDSLPPLPDLSKIVIPEPPIIIIPAPNSIYLNGLTGDFDAYDCSFNISRAKIEMSYKRDPLWSRLQNLKGDASYRIPIKHLWIRPYLNCYFQQITSQNKYALVNPGASIIYDVPWFVITGLFDYDDWTIYGDRLAETKAEASIIFDRAATIVPQISVTDVRSRGSATSRISSFIQLNRLNVGVEALIPRGFPSPKIVLSYRDRPIGVETTIRTGLANNTLKNFFVPETPYRLPLKVPDESLRVGLDISVSFTSEKNELTITAEYDDYIMRLAVGDDNFEYRAYHDIEEASLRAHAQNWLCIGNFTFSNTLHFKYCRTNEPLLFTPRLTIGELLDISYLFLDLKVASKYFSSRNGLNGMLPALDVIDIMCGTTYKIFRIYGGMFNVSDIHAEFYDDYLVLPRRYAVGLAVNYCF